MSRVREVASEYLCFQYTDMPHLFVTDTAERGAPLFSLQMRNSDIF